MTHQTQSIDENIQDDSKHQTNLESENAPKKRITKKTYNRSDYFFDVDVSHNPFSSIGLFTYLRTYARRLSEDDPNSLVETWEQCIKRVVMACNDQLKVGFKFEELRELFSLLFNLKCSVAGRFLWQLGTETVNESGLTSLMCCDSYRPSY